MLQTPVYKQGDLTVSELLSSVFPASLFLFIPQKVLQSLPHPPTHFIVLNASGNDRL